MGPIKYSALKAKASPRQVAGWREDVLREDGLREAERQGDDGPGEDGAGAQRHRPALRASRWVVVAAVLTLVFGALSVTAGLAELLARADTGALPVAATAATLAFGLLWVILQRRVRELAEGWRDTYRLMSFAKDNGFQAAPVATPADLPGRIFGRGLDEHRVRLDVVAWVQGGRQCHVATECWSSGDPVGGGAPLDEGSCRYLAVRIGRDPLPHTEFAAFGHHEPDLTDDERALVAQDPRLLATSGAERWAATLFSDRVTRLLTHSRQPRDAEVVGDWFIAYDLADSDPLSASGWERTFQLVSALPQFPVTPPSQDASELVGSPVVQRTTTRLQWAPRLWRRPARAVTG